MQVEGEGDKLDKIKLNKKHSSQFDPEKWYQRFEEAKLKRSDWDKSYEELSDIRDNVFDRDTGIMKDITDAPIIDNVMAKSIQFKDAVLTGGGFFIDIESLDNTFGEEQLLLEAEVNFAVSQQQIMAEIEMAKRDQSWYGIGWIRQYWNPNKINNVWKEGTPSAEYVNTRRMYIDPSCNRDDLKDRNYTFHVERFTKDDAYRIFKNKHKVIDENLTDSSVDEFDDYSGSNSVDEYIYVIIGEYKKVEYQKKVSVKDLDTGISDVVTLDGDDDYKNLLLETSQMEQIEVSDPFEVEEDAVFNFVITYNDGTLLSPPQYVGSLFSYTPITGFRLSKDPYTRGLAYMLKDLQMAQIVLVSVAFMLTVKSLKKNLMVEQGAIVNEAEFMEKRHSLKSPPAEIDEGWRERNPGAIPITSFDESGTYAGVQIFKEILDEAQKTTAGATDPAMGQANASDSGVKLAQMQTAAGQYNKWDENQYHRFLSNLGTWLKETIPLNRQGKHDIQINDIDGNKMTQEVRGSSFHTELYVCKAIVESGAEAVKQQKVNLYMQLKQMGVVSNRMLLSVLDVNNPDKVVEEAYSEQGVLEAVKVLQENPDLIDYVLNFKNQQKAIGQAGSAGEDTSNLQKKKKK